MNLQQLQQWLHDHIEQKLFVKAVLNKPTASSPVSKITIEPVLVNGRPVYHCSLQVGAQVKHENRDDHSIVEVIMQFLMTDFEQLLVRTVHADHSFYRNNDRSIGTSKQTHKKPIERVVKEHNRQKQYLLKEGIAVPFLIELGVMNTAGKVLAAKYDKFRQINRFLEMVADVAPELPLDRALTIIDFGCGKSYLTFAVHYFFTQLLKRPVTIIGLDLKAEVIGHCNRVAQKLGCDGLRFEVGDIAQFMRSEPVDMMISLHACDTATDHALAQAIAWKAQVILAVPCCHKEVLQQIKHDDLQPLLAYGIIKERTAALFTDALRAELLQTVGYKVQLLEFIDLEHTPKNILIRALKSDKPVQHDVKLQRCLTALHLKTTLQRLLADQ